MGWHCKWWYWRILGIYCLPPEHGRTVHLDSSYHGLVYGGGAEFGTVTIQAMVGAARYGYPRNNGGVCISGGGRGDEGRRIGGRGRVG